MDRLSLILSKSEVTTVVSALLEPHENMEISQARLLLAGKLYPYLSSPSTSGEQVADVSVCILGIPSAPHGQVGPDLFHKLLLH